MSDDMKQVPILELDETLDSHNKYTEQDIKSLVTQMAVKARCMGYKDIPFEFESTFEPYGDYLDSPMLRVNGWISKTEQDLKAENLEKNKRLWLKSWDAHHMRLVNL